MDLSFLFDIPVLGLFFQLMGWLVDVLVLFAPSIIGIANDARMAMIATTIIISIIVKPERRLLCM